MKQTALYSQHLIHGGKIVEFAGWQLPVYYSSIIEEHQAIRTKAGIFDVSHLGRLEISGPDTAKLVQYLATNDIQSCQTGDILYALVCNDRGGIEDDILIYYRNPQSILLLVNASNTDKIKNIIKALTSRFNFSLDDITPNTVMIAVQGPKAILVIESLFSKSFKEMKKYSFIEFDNYIVSRTGYTGEDGFEVIVSKDQAIELWNQLLQHGQSVGLIPCGLGARDTLRLEAGNCLYGHEMNATTNPFEAGLGFAVKLTKPDFIGKSKLIELKNKPLQRKLVGIELRESGVMRDGYDIFANALSIGKTTSGSYIPSLKKSIGMAYVSMDYAKPGTMVQVMIRNKPYSAVIVNKKWR